MATRTEFAAYVHAQLGGEAHGIACRKMFGEYGLHCFGKFFAVVCDDVLYFKPTPAGEALLAQKGALVLAPPYQGAKDYFQIDNPEDAAFLAELTEATCNALPEPKPKKPKPRGKAAALTGKATVPRGKA